MNAICRIWEVCVRAVRAAFVVREALNLWQWSDRFVYLSPKWSSRPGQYDSAYTFYLRGPMEALSARDVRQVTVVKGAQIGFTTMLANWVMYLVDMDPGPTLLALPSAKMAKRFVRRELRPRFLECARIKPYLPGDLRTQFTTTEMYFRTMEFFASGAGNAAQLASLPIKNAAGDEIDKWDCEDDQEASRKDLLEVRTLSYLLTRKIVLGSTPTIPEMTITVEAEKGTMERFFVRPSCCGKEQEILFENFSWTHIKGVKREDGYYDLDKVEKLTALRCTGCGALIPQSKKHGLIRRGRWVATNANAPADHRSFYVTGEIGNLAWGSLVKIFLQIKDTPGGLHHFHNSYLGRAWVRTAMRTTKKAIQFLQTDSPKYEIGFPQDPTAALVLPIRPAVITMQVDVQQTDFYWTLRAWDVDGARYLIGNGKAVSYSELVSISNRIWLWPLEDGGPPEEHSMFLGAMDSGYRAKRGASVYSFVHEQGGRWVATKGGGYKGREAPIVETEVQHNYAGGGQVTIPLVQYNDDVLKEHLYRFVIKERRPPGYRLPTVLDPEWVAEMTAEHLVKRKGDDGRPVYKWESDISPNYGDCEKIGEVLGFLLPKEALVAIRARQDEAREIQLAAVAARG